MFEITTATYVFATAYVISAVIYWLADLGLVPMLAAWAKENKLYAATAVVAHTALMAVCATCPWSAFFAGLAVFGTVCQAVTLLGPKVLAR